MSPKEATEGAQGWNLEAGTEAEPRSNPAYWLPYATEVQPAQN